MGVLAGLRAVLDGVENGLLLRALRRYPAGGVREGNLAGYVTSAKFLLFIWMGRVVILPPVFHSLWHPGISQERKRKNGSRAKPLSESRVETPCGVWGKAPVPSRAAAPTPREQRTAPQAP